MRGRSERRLLACLVACAFACGGESPPSEVPPAAHLDDGVDAPAAELRAKEGDVRWQTPAADVWIPAPVGQGFRVGDQVQTMDAATASVRLAGAPADIELAPASVLRIPPQDDVRSVRHVSGRLRARLDPSRGTTRLEVRLPPGDLVLTAAPGEEVVDSQIDVDDERTDVAMLRGRGVLRRRDQSRVVIADGEYARLEASGAILDRGVDLPAGAFRDPPPSVRTRGPVPLAWEAIPGAAAYRVSFTPAEGDALELDAEASPGRFRVPTGTYEVTLRALDASGRPGRPSVPIALAVEVDRTPPSLVLAAPRSGVVVEEATVHIAGTTDPGAALTVDRRLVAVAADGSFEAEWPIPRGVSNLVVSTRDDVGNARIVTRQVVRSR